jgi:hypothetical protein
LKAKLTDSGWLPVADLTRLELPSLVLDQKLEYPAPVARNKDLHMHQTGEGIVSTRLDP